MKRLLFTLTLAFAASVGSVVWADSLDLSVGECQTAPGGMNCGTIINTTVSPGATVLSTYVSIDEVPWQQISCLARGANAYVHQLPINWIYREHRHRFRFKDQADCTPAWPTIGERAAVGYDLSRDFLAPPASDSPDYGFVYRTLGSVGEWLYFTYEYEGTPEKGQWVHRALWSTSSSMAQTFQRRSAEILARLASSSNSLGPAAANDLTTWALPAPYYNLCVMRNTLNYRFKAKYDKLPDSWLWTSSFGPVYPSPDANGRVDLKFNCSDAESIEYLARGEAINSVQGVQGRHYGVREWRGDVGICGTPGYPSLC